MKSYFLGFDLGSHASKGVLISNNGTVLASKSFEHDTAKPNPGWQEQNPESWWLEFRKISKLLLERSGVDPSRVKGVGVTGFVPALVMLDQDGKPTRPAIMHTDIRAVSQLKFINQTLELEINQGFLLPKLLWVIDNEEEIYRSTSKILVPHSFIVRKLTGKYICDRDTASIFGGVYNEVSGNWSKEICDSLGINRDIFPELFDADSVVGGIDSQAAQSTGLPEGTPVIAGTGDTFAALLGCGAVLTGDMMVYLGTSATQLFIEGNLNDFIHGPHFGPGRAEFTGRIISCGDSMQHYRDILGFKDWSLPDSKALGIKPGSDGLFVFTHLKQKKDSEITKGNLETVFGLESSHSRWHIYRAVLEGIAANLKTSYLGYESKVERLVLSGGGARSRVFREIISAMLNKEIYYTPYGNGAIGIALLAGHSVTGISLKALSSLISSSAGITSPDSREVEMYELYYKKYIKFRNVIEELYKEQGIEDYE